MCRKEQHYHTAMALVAKSFRVSNEAAPSQNSSSILGAGGPSLRGGGGVTMRWEAPPRQIKAVDGPGAATGAAGAGVGLCPLLAVIPLNRLTRQLNSRHSTANRHRQSSRVARGDPWGAETLPGLRTGTSRMLLPCGGPA